MSHEHFAHFGLMFSSTREREFLYFYIYINIYICVYGSIYGSALKQKIVVKDYGKNTQTLDC